MKINWEENLIEFLFDFQISNNNKKNKEKANFIIMSFYSSYSALCQTNEEKNRSFIKYNSSRKLRSFIQFSELLLIHRAVRKLKNYF